MALQKSLQSGKSLQAVASYSLVTGRTCKYYLNWVYDLNKNNPDSGFVMNIQNIEQGASGVGLGNFGEIGPLDSNLKPRNSTWLKKADLLFVVTSHNENYSFFPPQPELVHLSAF